MTIFRATMAALLLVCFTAAAVPAAGQDARRPGKTAHHSTHAKKRTQVAPQAKPAASRGLRYVSCNAECIWWPPYQLAGLFPPREATCEANLGNSDSIFRLSEIQ